MLAGALELDEVVVVLVLEPDAALAIAEPPTASATVPTIAASALLSLMVIAVPSLRSSGLIPGSRSTLLAPDKWKLSG